MIHLTFSDATYMWHCCSQILNKPTKFMVEECKQSIYDAKKPQKQ